MTRLCAVSDCDGTKRRRRGLPVPLGLRAGQAPRERHRHALGQRLERIEQQLGLLVPRPPGRLPPGPGTASDLDQDCEGRTARARAVPPPARRPQRAARPAGLISRPAPTQPPAAARPPAAGVRDRLPCSRPAASQRPCGRGNGYAQRRAGSTCASRARSCSRPAWQESSITARSSQRPPPSERRRSRGSEAWGLRSALSRATSRDDRPAACSIRSDATCDREAGWRCAAWVAAAVAWHEPCVRDTGRGGGAAPGTCASGAGDGSFGAGATRGNDTVRGSRPTGGAAVGRPRAPRCSFSSRSSAVRSCAAVVRVSSPLRSCASSSGWLVQSFSVCSRRYAAPSLILCVGCRSRIE